MLRRKRQRPEWTDPWVGVFPKSISVLSPPEEVMFLVGHELKRKDIIPPQINDILVTNKGDRMIMNEVGLEHVMVVKSNEFRKRAPVQTDMWANYDATDHALNLTLKRLAYDVLNTFYMVGKKPSRPEKHEGRVVHCVFPLVGVLLSECIEFNKKTKHDYYLTASAEGVIELHIRLQF